nr:hypothetical protein [Desulfobacula sp.]
MKKYPRPGDKNERGEDLYLFLETLLSARQKLIITYTGMSIRDNSPIPCAGVVSELMEVMDQGFVFPKGYQYRFSHPLHPFDPAYFDGSGPLFSYSGDNGRLAAALISGKREPRPFVEMPDREMPGSGEPDREKPDESRLSVALEDIIRFFKNPMEGFVKNGLKITLKPLEEEREDREAFALAGLEQYFLGNLMLEKEACRSGEAGLYPVFRAMGSLPPGRKGRLEYERLRALAEPLIQEAGKISAMKRLPPVLAETDAGGIMVSGQITDVRETGLYLMGFGRVNGARLLSAWIRHVFLNAAGPGDYPRQTFLLGRDPRGKKPAAMYRFLGLGDRARLYLGELAGIFQDGGTTPFYFSCETAFQLAGALAADGFALTGDPLFKAMGRARKAGRTGTGAPGKGKPVCGPLL